MSEPGPIDPKRAAQIKEVIALSTKVLVEQIDELVATGMSRRDAGLHVLRRMGAL